jgi:signal transduction histidine kinase
MFRFRSLKTKVLFYFGGITIVILMLFNFTFYHFLEQNTKLSIQNDLYHKAVFINNEILANVPINDLLKNKELESFEVAIIKEGEILFKKGDTDFTSLMKYIEDRKSFFVFNREEKLDGLYIFKIHEPYKGAILFYEKNLDDKITSKLNEVKDILFFLEPILLLLLIFMVSKVTEKILKSINKITKTANQIYVTDFASEIPAPKYDDEIKDLVDSFNKMIKRLQSGVQLLEQFNSDVSHELKTPLTVIKSEIEVTLNKPRELPYYERTLHTIESETIQIQAIVDNLLILTKYTKENIKEKFQEISIDSLLLSIIGKFNTKLKEKNIKLHIEEFEAISLQANPILITSIFSNLIDNAIKYSKNDKNIHISLYKEKRVHFNIKDEGIGIAQEHLEKVQDRFYRVDESRNKKIKGFGLGLSIVKNSVELHEGSIHIQSKENIGTTIEVIL